MKRIDPYRNPLARARGLGSAKEGVEHWWLQRMTAVALIALGGAFVWLLLSLVGASHAELLLRLGNPFWAGAGILLSTALYWHLKLGLQVVIEDYVHSPGAKLLLLALNSFGCIVAGLATSLAFLSIAFLG